MPMPTSESEQDQLYTQARQIKNEANQLYILSVSTFGIGAALHQIQSLAERLLPPTKTTWFKWGTDKAGRIPAYTMMSLGAISFVLGWRYGKKASDHNPPIMGNVIDDPTTVRLLETDRERVHTDRIAAQRKDKGPPQVGG